MIIVIITNNILDLFNYIYSIDILLLRLLSSTKYHDGIAFRNHTMYVTLINKHVSGETSPSSVVQVHQLKMSSKQCVIKITIINSGWFPLRIVQTRDSVCIFCFASCKISQNHDIKVLQLISWSELKDSKQPPLWEAVEALCFGLSHITWWNNFAAAKINEAIGKTAQRWGMWSATFINIRLLRLHSTNWKSSLRITTNFIDT